MSYSCFLFDQNVIRAGVPNAWPPFFIILCEAEEGREGGRGVLLRVSAGSENSSLKWQRVYGYLLTLAWDEIVG